MFGCGDAVKYIKKRFDDKVSHVTRDYIEDFPWKTKDDKIDGTEDLIQVYPWETQFMKAVSHKIKNKIFIPKGTWDEYVKLRRIDIEALIEHVVNDKNVRIFQEGFFGYIINNIKKEFAKKKKKSGEKKDALKEMRKAVKIK